jgi:hypothetical protein
MINQGLMQEVIAIFYRRRLNVCLRLSPGGKHLCRIAFPPPENAFFGCAPCKVLTARQRLVDPANVAPEFREAAEKRRAEQVRQRDCAQKADAEKITPRERTAFLIHCLEAAEAK